MKKEKEICASFAITPQTEKLWPHDKCLVKMEKALHLDSKVF